MDFNYLQECRLLMQAFEKSQELMLKRSLKRAFDEFEIEKDQMLILFNAKLNSLSGKNLKKINVEFLFFKQLEKLIRFLKELDVLLKQMKNEKNID